MTETVTGEVVAEFDTLMDVPSGISISRNSWDRATYKLVRVDE